MLVMLAVQFRSYFLLLLFIFCVSARYPKYTTEQINRCDSICFYLSVYSIFYTFLKQNGYQSANFQISSHNVFGPLKSWKCVADAHSILFQLVNSKRLAVPLRQYYNH